jgi:pilus assembly protein Flp/PilA
MNQKNKALTKKNKKNQKGQGLIEYIILVAIIAVASIGVVRSLGHVTSMQLANITLALQGKGSRKIEQNTVHEGLYSKKDLSSFTRNSSQQNNN